MKSMKFIITVFIPVFIVKSAFGIVGTPISQKMEINNFIVKETQLNSNKLSIIATDQNEIPLKNINGIFQFSINGFKNEFRFNNGITVFPQQIDESTFIYLRHENESGTNGKLYYILSSNGNLNTFEISWIILAIIPLSILLLIFLFRKFIIIGGVILILVFFFNSKHGLNLSTFIDTIFDGLRNLV
ncbi:hypothetical protein [Daejeonella sp. H1SJ63]|uniref:hypothetical protein n=1 Tax=Daejeonella sp. H1SJ63 TaxID=3034145 RepID=UPI0023ED8B3F|nr:hypothetical protein [Daejeonella sp. H1SJ63]